MKKLYSLPWGRYVRPWVVFFVLLLLTVGRTVAQNVIFNERMSQIYAKDIIADAEANNYFDEQLLTYSGTGIGGDRSVSGIPQNTAAGASNLSSEDGYIILGDLSNGVASATSQERTFVIGDVLGPINNPILTFYLFVAGMRNESVASTNGNVILEASTDGGATYSSISYARVDGATVTARPAWAAFTTSSLPISSSLTIRFRKRTDANALYAIDDVQLTGVRNNISVSATTLNFGNTNVNAQSAAQQIRIAGANLQNDIIVTAPDGFLVRKGAEAYAVSTTLPRNSNGIVENTGVDVIFAPTTAKTYSATLSVTSAGSSAMSVNVNGTGITPPPATLVAPPSITFSGSTVVGQFSTPENFTVSGNNLVGNVTVASSSSYQIRVGNTGSFTSNPVTLTPTNGTLAETTLQVRFVPTTSGTIAGSIRVNSTNAGEQAIALSATATAAPAGPTVNAAPTDLAFGTASGSGSANTLTFDVSGTNLTNELIITPSNSNIVIRLQNVGSFTSSPLSFAPVNGTVTNRTIEVRLTGPVASGSFSGTISVGSDNALPKTVNVTASPVLTGNSTINTRGALVEFEAVPGQPSAAQSYIITGTNLLQDVQVEAPNFFQVSLTSNFSGLTSTGNTISIPRNSGNDLTETTIYVRYFPTTAQTNSSSILHNSDPALQVSLSVTGSSEPSLVLEQAYASNERVVLNTNGTPQGITLTGRRVNQPVTISFDQSTNSANPNNTPQFQLSLDNTTFSNTLVVTPDQQSRSISRTIYVRYSPTYLGGQNGASARLQFQSNDFANSATQSFTTNATVVGWSIDTRPTREAAVRVTRNGSTATVNFDLPGNYAAQGYGEGRLVIASENAALAQLPVNGTPYTTGNQKYGVQEFTGSPGYFVVFSGANSEALIESLNPTKTYYFYTFEYNNVTTINGRLTSVQTAENYMTPTTPDAVPAYVAPGTPLPVELKSFAAKFTASGVKLDWATASEKNNKGFEVQRSQDGTLFTVMQFVNGQGSKANETVYSTIDAQPLSGTSYYRLKQVDYDGTFAYSPVVAVTNTEAAREISFYPNPAHDVLNIVMEQPAVGARVTVTDLTGRVLLTTALDASNSVSLNSLRAGTYLVTVETNSQKITRKVVKE